MNERIDRKSWIAAVGLTLGLACLYLFMLPTRLTWINFGGDSGDFLAAVRTAGIPHPSGYPTYVLLARVFQFLPLSTPYWRAALLSALSAALAAGLLCLWTARFAAPQRDRAWLPGLTAGLAWGTAPLVWSQALIVEVHGLQALFVVLWMWWLGLLASGRSGWQVTALAILAGLSLGNHLTIILLFPALFGVLYLELRLGTKPLFILGQVGLIGLGALVYLYFPLSARNYPPVNWGNPQTIEGFLWTVTGQPYRGLLFQTPAQDLLGRISAWAQLIIAQFGLPGMVFGAVGAVQAGFTRPALRWLLVWMFAVFTTFAVGYSTADSVLYMLPAYLAAAVWVGQGLATGWTWRWRGVPVGMLLAAGMAVFLLLRLPLNAEKVDPRMHAEAADYAEAYLRDAPQGAFLLTTTDADTFPLWYEHYALGSRPDVVVIVLPLTQFAWYRETLAHTYLDVSWPPLESSESDDWGEGAVKLNPGRPVCRSQVEQTGMQVIPNVTYACQ
jgi:hypothetical protein